MNVTRKKMNKLFYLVTCCFSLQKGLYQQVKNAKVEMQELHFVNSLTQQEESYLGRLCPDV